MPRKNPLHVESFTDRHGRQRLYFRRGKGGRTSLPGPVGSPEFLEAYAAALAGEAKAQHQTIAQPAAGTISALIASYMQSERYRSLRQTTRAGYSSRLEAIRNAHGHRTVSGLTRERILIAFLQPLADKPGAYLDTIKKLRILIQHAIMLGWLKVDPSAGIKRPKSNEIAGWTDEEIAQFEARWPIGTKQRLVFALMLYTGQRRNDVHRMTWRDVGATSIRVVQQKTGAKLTIPLHRALAAVLAAAGREHVVIIATAAGAGHTVDGFSGYLRDAITDAGLPLRCQPHGLRKAAGRRLAEAGCSANEIMAVLGHKTLAEAERYTRDADQTRLARAAVTRLEAHGANNVSQTPSGKFGENPKK